MNILDLISNETGYSYKKKANTLGGEFGGPCPFCSDHGKDRFSIIPSRDHFVCRRCIAGDSIKFIREYHKKTYFEACSYLNIQPFIKYESLNTAADNDELNHLTWQPRKTITSPEIWQDKATATVFNAFKYLISPQGKNKRDYLNNRGIDNNTIKTFRLGFQANVSTFLKKSWGVIKGKNKQPVEGKIWLPIGFIIPQFKNNKVIRIRIRQEKPISKDRFILVSGSETSFFSCDDHIIQTSQNIKSDKNKNELTSDLVKEKPALIVEAELDAILLYQFLSDMFDIYAIGNSSARPDVQTHEKIKDKLIILNLDNDKAGQSEIKWWESQYENVYSVVSDMGKDAGEDYQAGVDIRKWGENILKNIPANLLNNFKNKKNSDQKKDNKPESFKNEIYKNYQAKKQIKEKIDNIPANEFFDSKIEKLSQKQSGKTQVSKKKNTPVLKQKFEKKCLHDQFCINLKENICLLDKLDIFTKNKKCPKKLWYRWVSDSGILEEIILAPGIKRI